MRTAIHVFFQGTPAGGMAKLVDLLRGVGATRIGCTSVIRAPIELAEPDMLRYADDVELAGDTWTAAVNAGPIWSIDVSWAEGAIETATTMLARLVAAGSIDFAVAHSLVAGTTDPLDAYRDELICNAGWATYHDHGPSGLGASTYLSTRVLSLVDDPHRSTLERAGKRTGDLLHILPSTDPQRRELQAAFVAGGVAAVVPRRAEVSAGPRWEPPEEGAEPAGYKPKAAKLIDELQSVRVADGDAPVTGLKGQRIVAPFARATGTHAEDLDVEDSKLPFADFSGARIHDARFGGADMRAVDARDSEWIDVGLAETDLRWATFAKARLAYSRLDEANCAHIDLTEATELEQATNACFDNATAPRWSADEATLTGASFQNADLREASFRGANLENARFDGADLTGASFRDANLTGAVFTGAKLTNTDMTGATTEGATFDRS